MAAKSPLECLFQEKEEKLEPSKAAFVWMVWTFYYSPFPSVPVRFVCCNVCVLVYRMRLSTHLFLRKRMLSQRNRLARLERSQAAHFIMNASQYWTLQSFALAYYLIIWSVHSSVVSFLSFLFFKTYHVLDPNNTVCPAIPWLQMSVLQGSPAEILVVNENFEGKKN